jgi:hypothetical protein
VVPREGVRNVGATLEAALSGLRDAVEVAKLWRSRYRRLARRVGRALERLRDAIVELEAAGGDPHVRAGLEHLYEVERLLGVVEE